MRGVPPDQFFVPGSLLRLTLDPHEPLTFGLPSATAAFFAFGSGFETAPPRRARDRRLGARRLGARIVARYGRQDMLLSGWLEGERVDRRPRRGRRRARRQRPRGALRLPRSASRAGARDVPAAVQRHPYLGIPLASVPRRATLNPSKYALSASSSGRRRCRNCAQRIRAGQQSTCAASPGSSSRPTRSSDCTLVTLRGLGDANLGDTAHVPHAVRSRARGRRGRPASSRRSRRTVLASRRAAVARVTRGADLWTAATAAHRSPAVAARAGAGRRSAARRACCWRTGSASARRSRPALISRELRARGLRAARCPHAGLAARAVGGRSCPDRFGLAPADLRSRSRCTARRATCRWGQSVEHGGL